MKHIRQVKHILVVAFLLLSIVAVTQPATTYAATLPIGVVNYQILVQQHPDTAQANETYKAALTQAQEDYKTKAATMNDNDKKAYSAQVDQGLRQKKQELLNAIREKINAAVKEVADSKGLAFVADKSISIYGGQDITDDVLKKIKGK